MTLVRKTLDLHAEHEDALDQRIVDLRQELAARRGRVLQIVRWRGRDVEARRARVMVEVPPTESTGSSDPSSDGAAESNRKATISTSPPRSDTRH